MELRQLRCFVALAEERHFGRAAEKLHISQPPLSMQIRALENELGVTLLNRTQRHVSPTQADAALLGQARHILARMERAVLMARRASRGEIDELAIGFISVTMICRRCGCSSMPPRRQRGRRARREQAGQPHERYDHY